jgi:hypothetical protein
MQLSPFLQNLAKRIIVAVDNEIVEHELILRFAYLRSLKAGMVVQNMSASGYMISIPFVFLQPVTGGTG